MHLADAFIQGDVSVHAFPGNGIHTIWIYIQHDFNTDRKHYILSAVNGTSMQIHHIK